MKKSFYVSSVLVSCFMLFSLALNAAVPVITVNTVADTVCSGTTAQFFVTVTDTTTGATSISYAWQVSTDGGSTWSFITDVPPYSNSATDTLNVMASNALNGYLYRSIDTNNDGADTSLAAMLSVDTLNAGTITGLSALCVGSTETLSDAVAGGVWSHINHLADTLSPSEMVTGLAQGFDTITYVISNICGIAVSSFSLRVDITATVAPITGPTATCVGHTIDLANTNVLGTGIWSASNTTASITSSRVVMGLSGGFDTITYAFTNACNAVTTSVVLSIDTVLNAGTISGPSAVCAGSWIHLNETVSGGIWLSGSPHATVDGSGNVTGVSGGTVTISYLFSNACGERIAMDTITVDSAASTITGGDSVGVGAMLTLSNSIADGTWSIAYPGGDTVATMDSGTVTGIAVGTTTVTYTVTNTCGTTYATMTLYVGNAPSAVAIEGPDTVCVGTTGIFSDNSFPGGVWISSSDSIATINSSTGVLTGNVSGYVAVYYAIHNAFGSDTISATIFVGAIPSVVVSGPSAISLGQEYYFLAAPCCGIFTASNYTDGGFVIDNGSVGDTVIDSVRYPSAGFASFVVTHTGIDTITYSVSNLCGTGHNYFVINLAPVKTSVSTVTAENELLNIYPNPNQGTFTLNLNSGANEQVPVTITNIAGESVKELTIPTNTSVTITLDQPAGIYFLSANSNSGKYAAKITITK